MPRVRRRWQPDLVTSHRFVLVFLKRTAKAVQCGIYFVLGLVSPIFERRAPAQSNHGPNDHDFNDQSHIV